MYHFFLSPSFCYIQCIRGARSSGGRFVRAVMPVDLFPIHFFVVFFVVVVMTCVVSFAYFCLLTSLFFSFVLLYYCNTVNTRITVNITNITSILVGLWKGVMLCESSRGIWPWSGCSTSRNAKNSSQQNKSRLCHRETDHHETWLCIALLSQKTLS